MIHCTHSNGICHTALLTACEQDQDGTAFPLQQWLGELASMLRCTYIAYLVRDCFPRHCPYLPGPKVGFSNNSDKQAGFCHICAVGLDQYLDGESFCECTGVPTDNFVLRTGSNIVKGEKVVYFRGRDAAG